MFNQMIASALQKAQLAAFLGLPTPLRMSKAELVAQVQQRITVDPNEQARLLETFVHELAVGPHELEELLQCSKTERLRWIKEGRIPVLEYRTFRKGGKDLRYPIHDRRVVQALSREELARWREEHLVQVQQSRQRGVQAAALQRSINQHKRSDFLAAWMVQIAAWAQQGSPALAAVLQLAYWAVWASRWAKENLLKAVRSSKHADTYAERRDRWYERKNEAMQVLAQTPYARLSFYRPNDPDRWDFHLCSTHNEERREGFYEDIWEFYALHEAEIQRCSSCSVRVEKDYYALYYLEICAAELPDVHFSFHMPYPIGRSYFPRPDKLPTIAHIEQAGPFRFGRALLASEKITHRERDVLTHFEQALAETRQHYRLDGQHRCRSPPCASVRHYATRPSRAAPPVP